MESVTLGFLFVVVFLGICAWNTKRKIKQWGEKLGSNPEVKDLGMKLLNRLIK